MRAVSKTLVALLGPVPVQRCVRHKECHEAVTSAAEASLEGVPVREESRDGAVRGDRLGDPAAPAVTSAGAVVAEGWTPADEDGLGRLVGHVGPEAVACLEMMSGAAWVRDRLRAAGWTVQIGDAVCGDAGRCAAG